MNWWRLTLWDGETIDIRPDQEPAITQRMAGVNMPGAPKFIILGSDMRFAVSDIKTLEETYRPYVAVTALPASTSTVALVETERGVRARFVKRLVKRRAWDGLGGFGAKVGYHFLSEDEETGDVWMAFTAVMKTDGSLPPAAMACNPEEIKKLCAKVGHVHRESPVAA